MNSTRLAPPSRVRAAVQAALAVTVLTLGTASAEGTRTEKDLLGPKEIPNEAYYGVQTARALENFQISGVKINQYPGFVEAWAIVKLAAARANTDVGAMKPETLAAIQARYPLIARDDDEPSSTAQTYRFADGAPGSIGLIAPVTSPFCGACSRLRLTADGKLRPCLFSTSEWDLRSRLRDAAADDRDLAGFMIDATWTKQAGHGVAAPGFVQPERPMSAIGG